VILAVLVSCGPAEKPAAPVAPQPDPAPKTCPVSPPAGAPHAQMMPIKLVDGRRPDDLTKNHMHEHGLAAVRAEVVMCLDESGAPSGVTMTSSSCLPDYDKRILTKIAEWRFKPFEISGKPSAICTTVTFVYRQANVRAVTPNSVTF
jgi:hypothetical protein